MDIRTEGTTLVLVGVFDARSTMEVRNALYELLARGEGAVVVDLSGVDAMDVTALRVLAMASRHAGRSGHHLVLRGCRPAIRRLLHVSRLARVIEVERRAATA